MRPQMRIKSEAPTAIAHWCWPNDDDFTVCGRDWAFERPYDGRHVCKMCRRTVAHWVALHLLGAS